MESCPFCGTEPTKTVKKNGSCTVQCSNKVCPCAPRLQARNEESAVSIWDTALKTHRYGPGKEEPFTATYDTTPEAFNLRFSRYVNWMRLSKEEARSFSKLISEWLRKNEKGTLKLLKPK
jgi:hypothetical protein